MLRRLWRKHRVPASILASLTLLLSVRSANAQVSEAWLRYTTLDAYARGSARLQSMGGIEVSAKDDQSRFDPYYYCGNPAGLVAARDTSLIETPLDYQDFNDSYFGQAHSAVQRGASIHTEFRPGGRWAAAADLDYGTVAASRHDDCLTPDCRFVRDFDLPIAPGLSPVTAGQTFGASVSTPWASLTYAREVLGHVTAGARVGYRHESEDRLVSDPYDLDVTNNAAELSGGLLYRAPILNRGVSISGWGTYLDQNVVARSQSALNDDEYDWDRPQVSYGAAIHIRKGTWLEGIIDGRHRSHDGEQVARVNWAPQFFLNPFPSETDPLNVFKKTWSSFLSGLRHNEASTRWLVGIPGTPVNTGVRWGYFREYEWIRRNESVIDIIKPLDVKRQGYRFAGGLSVDLADHRGVAAAEAHIAREFREDFLNVVPDLSMMSYTYHFGAEYRVHPAVPVRAGVQMVRHDPDHADGFPPLKGAGVSLGAGYFWKLLDSKVDVAYTHLSFRSSPGDPADQVGSGDQVSVYIQRLF